MKIQKSAVLFLIAVFALSALQAPAVFAQPVINEVMSSNSSTVQDEDGDFPDWIEIYNSDADDVNLAGYGLSDDPAEPFKWVFPDYTLGAGEYVLVFASDKDRTLIPNHWETVVKMGDEFKYAIGAYSIPEDWRTLGFDDSGWDAGATGIGSMAGKDATIIGQERAVFLRRSFTVDDVANVTHTLLNIDYEDGFVAYINGVEVARANMDSEPGTIPAATKLSSGERKMLMYDGGDPELHNVENFAEALQAGENILAIEVHNNAGYFSDISVIPFLTFGMKEAPADPAGVPESLASSMKDIPFHTNYKIKSGGETLVLTSRSGVMADSLVTGVIAEDVSLGRKPDGGETLVFFVEPTPGASNTATAITGYADEVSVSFPGGVYEGADSVELTVVSEAATIRYTLDGSVPTDTSTEYTGAVSIDSTSVLRARAFEPGKFPGPVNTNTYLINEDIDLPIISVSTNPENLWDPDIGIYVKGNSTTRGGYVGIQPTGSGNYCEDWERPIHAEMYEPNGTQGFSIDAGMKIVGKGSRGNPQKNIAIFARPEYGYDSIDYKIFPDLPTSSFQSIVLRAGGS
ncbi:chitobiase/beta-hexosaminidase C-terminal domain-containing protein, partial [Candidatus Latescibacterota bacterium]